MWGICGDVCGWVLGLGVCWEWVCELTPNCELLAHRMLKFSDPKGVAQLFDPLLCVHACVHERERVWVYVSSPWGHNFLMYCPTKHHLIDPDWQDVEHISSRRWLSFSVDPLYGQISYAGLMRSVQKHWIRRSTENKTIIIWLIAHFLYMLLTHQDHRKQCEHKEILFRQ